MDEPFAEMVDTLNGRRIQRLGPDGCYGWFVETRGPKFGEKYLSVWHKAETLDAAREDAIRRGPMPEQAEV
jgi:hypothetical protein